MKLMGYKKERQKGGESKNKQPSMTESQLRDDDIVALPYVRHSV